MALIKCSECGKEISDKAKTCPNCGARPNIIKISKNIKSVKTGVSTGIKSSKKTIIVGALLIIASIIMVVVVKEVNKYNFIKDYIGGYNKYLLNENWVNKSSDSTETLVFYKDHSCHYSKHYKKSSFTIGNRTLPTIDKDFKCYYKIEYEDENNHTKTDSFSITIYKLDVSRKKAEKIHELGYYYYSDYQKTPIIASIKDYNIEFYPESKID